MGIFQPREFNPGFVILCPTGNVGQLATTMSSLAHGYPNSPSVTVIPSDCTTKSELEKRTKVAEGRNTITSLINAGLSNPPSKEWNFVVMAGAWVRTSLDKKFSHFIRDTKDILYPVMKQAFTFVDSSINGFLIHADSFKEIGRFCEDNPLEICKLMWALDATEKGYRFVGVVGTRIC